MKSLFAEDLNVINVGLQGFADNIVAAGGSVTNLSFPTWVTSERVPKSTTKPVRTVSSIGHG